MTVSGTVRATGGPASMVAGAVVRATNLDTGASDGEATTDMNGSYTIQGLRGDRYSIEVTPPSGYLSVAPVHVTRPESGDPEVSANFSLLYYTPADGAVTTLPAGRLILKPANYFDLEGKTLTFSPNGTDGYVVAVSGPTWEEPGRSPAVATSHGSGEDHDLVAVDLPFPFSFAGRTWTRVYANANGHISFQRPEHENWSERDPWSDATMHSVAAAIDSRSAAGMEAMIAALWAIYGDTTISVDPNPARVMITWRAVRPTPGYAYHAPLGENLFQARLYPSGVVELGYRAVAERDGFVGLFHGGSARGRTLGAADDAVGDVGEPVLDITSVELVDNGSTVLARMTLAEDVPQEVADGTISYRIFLKFANYDCAAGLEVTASGRKPFSFGCGAEPVGVGYRVRGATVEIPISKTRLHGADRFSWEADAVWWGREEIDEILEAGTVRLDKTDADLGAIAGAAAGNVFEVFHYPVFPKEIDQVTSFIYERAPADDEIAVLFTDFRIDDVFGHGPGSGAINTGVQGIGWDFDPNPGHIYGSDSLLVTMSPLFIGGANFWRETGVSEGSAFRNFSEGIWWIAHEATHRWLADLRFRNPHSGQVEALNEGGHWYEWLHAPEVYPVWPSFSSERYVGTSVQGGAVWADNGDGTFTRKDNRGLLATGLSALDLYAMGMIPPDEVPDTFILRAGEGTDPSGTVRATKVPVRIEDIVAAVGPRVPPAETSRKEFRLGVYLLHDGRTPRPDLLQRAQDVSAAVSEYFFRATGGRMRVVPSPGSGQ